VSVTVPEASNQYTQLQTNLFAQTEQLGDRLRTAPVFGELGSNLESIGSPNLRSRAVGPRQEDSFQNKIWYKMPHHNYLWQSDSSEANSLSNSQDI